MAPRSVNPRGHPLSRTYGVTLQSSLTSVLPSALDYSSRLPVSVLVRSPKLQPLEAFLGRTLDDFPNLNAVGPHPRLTAGGFSSPTTSDESTDFLVVPLTLDAPSLHRSTSVAQEC